MIYFYLWLACVVVTGLLAKNKNRSVVGFVALAIFFFPVALILIAVLPKKPIGKTPQPLAPFTDLRAELNSLKKQLDYITLRIRSLEEKISVTLPQESSSSPQVEPEPVVVPQVNTRKVDMEANMGRFWLNRAGIIILTLGVGFFISYTYKYFDQYFGPWLKIIIGYLISAGLFYFGLRFEKKELMRNYGRVILGGAWAVTYLTTYATYHFDASKIISSQLLCLLLLAVVVAGIIVHSLKYKSQELSSLALFIGYLTATLGNVNYFTFITSAMLAVAALILVYRMQWFRMIFTGILLTYFTHFVWIIRQIWLSRVEVSLLSVDTVHFMINSGFLLIYWVLFTAGIHLLRTKEESVYNKLSAANFCNFILFFIMGYRDLSVMYPPERFTFVFLLGAVYLAIALVMDKIKNNKLFVSNIIIALSLLTLSVPLKYMPFYTSAIWLVELPFLVFVGLYFDRRVLRYFSLVLGVFIISKILLVDFEMKQVVTILGLTFSWKKFIFFLSTLSLGVSFYLCRYAKKSQGVEKSILEEKLYNLFSALGVLSFTFLLWLVVGLQWLSFSLFLEMTGLFLLGVLLKDSYFRGYALLLLAVIAGRFCFVDDYERLGHFLKWLVLGFEFVCLYAVYFLYKHLQDKLLLDDFENHLVKPVFVISTLLLIVGIFRYVPGFWISLALGLAGVAMFCTGFISKEKIFRFSGFIIFALTISRVLTVDLGKLAVIYKIISFIVLGILFLGVSFIYTKYNVTRQK